MTGLLQIAGSAFLVLGVYWIYRQTRSKGPQGKALASSVPSGSNVGDPPGKPAAEKSWTALREGDVVLDGEHHQLMVVDAGDLVLPSGRLVACDPFTAMRQGGNPFIQVPPGRYPVRITLADVSRNQDGSHIREAYASMILKNSPEVRRQVLTALQSFPVDSGTACFVDDQALVTGMPSEDEWLEKVFENDQPDSWFSRIDDSHHLREGIANVPLPLAKDGANAVLVHSGWGDGVFPVIGGYDAKGELVAVHIDFEVM